MFKQRLEEGVVDIGGNKLYSDFSN